MKRSILAKDATWDDASGALLVSIDKHVPVQLSGFKTWATGTDAYAAPASGAWTAAADIIIRVKRCDDACAVISIDGGTTDSIMAVANVSDDQWYHVPTGGVIQAKNETAGSAFSNLVIEWAVA